MDLLEQCRETIRRYQMLQPQDRVIVAVSGGPDSVVLLHVLLRFRSEYGLTLHVAHLHHCLRPEATEEMEYVRSLAGEWGLPFHYRIVDVARLARENRESVEEAGRRARYTLFRELTEELQAQRVALGHHADDQAETVLINLLRGTGPLGLAGIPPVRGPYIRPLLHCSREEILAYAREHKLTYYEDVTNRQPIYLRNRIRQELLPLLETYNPRIRGTLAQLASITYCEGQVMESLAAKYYRKLKMSSSGGGPKEVSLFVQELLALPLALQRRLVRQAYGEVTGHLRGLTFDHVEQLLQSLGEKLCLDWPQGCRVISDGSLLTLREQTTESVPSALAVFPLPCPGECHLPMGLYLSAKIVDQGPTTFDRGSAGFAPLVTYLQTGQGSVDFVEYIDLARCKGPLYVRGRRAGDRVRLLGSPGTRKLKDIFIDAKIPNEVRDLFPLVCDGEGILWVPGFTIADRVKITRNTAQVLQLRLKDQVYG